MHWNEPLRRVLSGSFCGRNIWTAHTDCQALHTLTSAQKVGHMRLSQSILAPCITIATTETANGRFRRFCIVNGILTIIVLGLSLRWTRGILLQPRPTTGNDRPTFLIVLRLEKNWNDRGYLQQWVNLIWILAIGKHGLWWEYVWKLKWTALQHWNCCENR